MTEKAFQKYKEIVKAHNNKCHVCGKPFSEMYVFAKGDKREKAQEVGLMIPLCKECCDKVYADPQFGDILFRETKKKVISTEMSSVDFFQTFGKPVATNQAKKKAEEREKRRNA